LPQKVDKLPPAAGVASTCAPEGFSQCAGGNVDAIDYPAVLVSSAAGLAPEARGMAVVEVNEGPIAIGKIANLVELGHRAIHAEDAIGGDQLAASSGRVGLFESLFEFRHVARGIAKALRLAESHPVDNR